MTPLQARVENGRLLLDEPTELPDGTVAALVADDEGDHLTEHERLALPQGVPRRRRGARRRGRSDPSGFA